MIDQDTILKHSPDINNSFELSDGLVARISDKLHTMNETAREILEMFDGSRSVCEIINDLVERYPDNDDVNIIVEGFIKRLYEEGLIVE
ncbi:MAG: PqqD family peptide modification chaperone [Candidatus Brocadiales bacterium]|nr:PqqD family peptide modification chaperone [Candidatus Brocadiales bacterium]